MKLPERDASALVLLLLVSVEDADVIEAAFVVAAERAEDTAVERREVVEAVVVVVMSCSFRL